MQKATQARFKILSTLALVCGLANIANAQNNTNIDGGGGNKSKSRF